MTEKEVTTVKISRHTASILASLKIHPRQPYEEVILKFVNERNSRKSQPNSLQSSSDSKDKKDITTIKLTKKTAEILNRIKIHPRQSYEEVILNLISQNGSAEKKK